MSRSISFMLTLSWNTDILLHELRPETEWDEFEKDPLHYNSFLGWGFHGRSVFFFYIFSGFQIGLPN